MKKRFLSFITITMMIATTIQAQNPISDAGCLSGPLNGILVAGKTYHVCGNIIVNFGDTLIIEPSVTIKFQGNYGLGVHGSLFSLGTQSNPILFTYDSASLVKTDNIGANKTQDPAFKGLWTGIIADTACPYLVFKWTHIEFAGGAPNGSVARISKTGYPIYFQNPNGIFVLEDSWIYGSVDDAIRTYGGKLAIMRNTFEKCGYTGGEALNAKAGTIGDYGYNLCVGIATNGPKLSNAGAAPGVAATEMHIYNNTIINCGYRRNVSGRGGSINFEQDARGLAYNNILVNCKFGLRVVSNPIADTANLKYGYNLNYGDSVSVVNQFVPSLSLCSSITTPQNTNIPSDFSFLPFVWKIGDTYAAASSFQGANNPLFINGPCPLPSGAQLQDITVVSNYDFRLKSNSPCLGKGYQNFIPLATVPVDPKYGVTELTSPGKDLGAFQFDGSGNKHYEIPTPVSLISFTATTNNNIIQTTWQTATELNTANFIIQHSTNGSSFSDIGTVIALGSGANSYQFIDNTPANGMNYFRIKMMDKDGSSSYSKVVSITFDDKNYFSIIPNPARDFATISFSNTVDKIKIAVYDITGKKVITHLLSGNTNTYKLNTQSLKSGLYVVKIITTAGNYNEKLLINK